VLLARLTADLAAAPLPWSPDRCRPASPARAAGEDTFTYGLMHQRQACQAATMEQTLPRFTARGYVNHQS
jgi:hypothetical protein